MSVTMVARLLDLADEMIAQSSRSSAVKRRAVSTAYYAVFHALMKACADAILPDLERGSTEYARVYRAIDHGSLKNAFQASGSPLKMIPELRRIGDLVVPLQSARMLADYAPPRIGFYDGTQAEDLIGQAREIVTILDNLEDGSRTALAVHLIFKDRSR